MQFTKVATMSNLICPFCNKPLQPTLRQSDEYWCENYDCPQTSITWVGTSSLWKAFADTKKKLDIAVNALDAGRTLARIAGFEMLATGMDEALDKITALEQKDK